MDQMPEAVSCCVALDGGNDMGETAIMARVATGPMLPNFDDGEIVWWFVSSKVKKSMID